jgi:hypothetical protein
MHAVPQRVASEFQRLHATDVRHVPVLRGPLATRLARALDARALTARGQVILPDEAGGLDDPETQALLAHELVHHAQQRVGVALPGESSPDGRRMEQAAVATERWFRGEHVPMAHLRLPAARSAGVSASAEPGDHVQHLVEEVVEQRYEQVQADAQRAPLASALSGAGTHPQHGAPFPVPDMNSAPTTTGPTIPRAPVTVRSAATGLPGVLERFAEVRRSVGLPEQVKLMSDETERELRDTLRQIRGKRSEAYPSSALDLDELAARLYGRIRGSLRHELLVDRERSGLLADFR